MHTKKNHHFFRLFACLLCTGFVLHGFTQTQQQPHLINRNNLGVNDTVIVQACIEPNGDTIPCSWLADEYVLGKMTSRQHKRYVEWTRLRNAVYVTYPYARVAGYTINEINAKLKGVTSKKERKAIIKSREKELRKQFSEPLSNLSVYQGRVLMKLINRQTGNNCYEIIKEYKGGLDARLYQTVAFFVGGNLKQDYDLEDKTDRQIENFVREIDGMWYNNPYRK